jgi:hypothetical protein
MKVPIYKGGSMTKFLREMEKFTNQLNQDRYNIVINFVNDWLRLKDDNRILALSQFNAIPETRLLKTPKHNRKVIRKYTNIFKQQLNVDLSVTDETDSDEIKDKYIIYVTRRILSSIDYKLYSFKNKNIIYYSIKKSEK